MGNELVDSAKGMPWYALLSAGLFMTGTLILGIKRYLSKDSVSSADDRATVNSIKIYQDLLQEQRDALKEERESRVAAEAKHDELLQKYADLSGTVSQLKLQVEQQKDMLDRQDTVIAQLRDKVAALTGGNHANDSIQSA